MENTSVRRVSFGVTLFAVALLTPAAYAALKWECNYAHVLHDAKEDCSHPEEGGQWVDDGKGASDKPAFDLNEFWDRSEDQRGQVIAEGAKLGVQALAMSGYKYGRDVGKQQMNCTMFTAGWLKSLGVNMTDEMGRAVNIAGIKPKDLNEALALEDDQIRGVQRAIVDIAKIGDTVKPKDVKVGDFIQLWYRKDSDSDWGGHSGIVSSVTKDSSGHVRVQIASPSESASKSNGGIVKSGSDKWDMSKDDPEIRKVYIARITKRP